MNLRHYLLSGDQFKIQTSFQLVNFRLRSFFVITLVQSKQICSFGRCRRNAYTLDYLGRSEWNRFFPPFIKDRDTSCHSHHSSCFARNANENPSRETSRSLASSLLAWPLRRLTIRPSNFTDFCSHHFLRRH